VRRRLNTYLAASILDEIDAAREALRRRGHPNLSRSDLLAWAWRVAHPRPSSPQDLPGALLSRLESLEGRPVDAGALAAAVGVTQEEALEALRDLRADGCAARLAGGLWVAAGY
jgi:hypothetical protein